ncbi:MAG: glycosyltransferase family 2 protein [Verrucomicrobiota bacterium]|nr:glycosyltransferase family 2 protein [Verrucomicrobiota bacterium]
MSEPVIFILFNRPEKTARVFDAIRQYKPSRLHIIADGPRLTHENDEKLCKSARSIIDTVDWRCDLTHDYATQNMGCRQRVSTGLVKAFEIYERAIILEDDCLPNQSFFNFSEELLDRYESREEIMHIGGNNFLSQKENTDPGSYYFSKLFHIWGWATWRRAWKFYDVDMKDWPRFKKSGHFKKLLPDPLMRSYWSRTFDLSYNKKIDSWDHQWCYACLKAGGFSATPKTNLVINIGFDADATHTRSNQKNPASKSCELSFPLSHPNGFKWNRISDRIVQKKNFKRSYGGIRTFIDIVRGI